MEIIRLRLKAQKHMIFTMTVIIALISSIFFLLYQVESVTSYQNLGAKLKNTADIVGEADALAPSFYLRADTVEGPIFDLFDYFESAVNQSIETVFHQRDGVKKTEVYLTFLLYHGENNKGTGKVHVVSDELFIEIMQLINESWRPQSDSFIHEAILVQHEITPVDIQENRTLYLYDIDKDKVLLPRNYSIHYNILRDRMNEKNAWVPPDFFSFDLGIDFQLIMPHSLAITKYNNSLKLTSLESVTGNMWLQEALVYQIIFSNNPEYLMESFKKDLITQLESHDITMQPHVLGQIFYLIETIKPVKDPIRIQVKIIRVLLWFLGITAIIASVSWTRFQRVHVERELAQLLPWRHLAFLRSFEALLTTIVGVSLGLMISSGFVLTLQMLEQFQADLTTSMHLFPWFLAFFFVITFFPSLLFDVAATRQLDSLPETLEEISTFQDTFKKLYPIVLPFVISYLTLEITTFPTISFDVDVLTIIVALGIAYFILLNISLIGFTIQVGSWMTRLVREKAQKRIARKWHVLAKIWGASWRRQIFALVALMTIIMTFSSAMILVTEVHLKSASQETVDYQFEIRELHGYNGTIRKKLRSIPEVESILTEFQGEGTLGTEDYLFSNDLSLSGYFADELLAFYSHSQDLLEKLKNTGIIPALQSSRSVVISPELETRYPLGSNMTLWYYNSTSKRHESMNLTVAAINDHSILKGASNFIINGDLFLKLFDVTNSTFEVNIYIKTQQNIVDAYKKISTMVKGTSGVLERRVSLELLVTSHFGLTIPMLFALAALGHLILALAMIESRTTVTKSTDMRMLALLSLSEEAEGRGLLLKHWLLETMLVVMSMISAVVITLGAYGLIGLTITAYWKSSFSSSGDIPLPTMEIIYSSLASALVVQLPVILGIIVVLLVYQGSKLVQLLRSFDLPIVLRHHE